MVLALKLYGKAGPQPRAGRRIAGLPKWDFLELLARERIPIHYGEEELEEDLKMVRRLVMENER